MSLAMEEPTTTEARQIAWLRDLPPHWDIARGKALFYKVQRDVREQDEVITAFRDGEVTLRKNRRKDGFTESLKEIGYQGIRKGDLVIHAMDGFAGAIGVSDADGKSSPVYQVCLPRTGEIKPSYYAYLLREMARSEYITALATGIRERSTDFRFDDFASQLYPRPPREEQEAIVAFLNHKLEEIDSFIANKCRLIELLEERREGIVENTILSAKIDCATKSSRLMFVDEIPNHWVEKRAKYFLREVDIRSETGEEELLSVSHITGVTPRSEKNITMFKAESYVGYKMCYPSDLVVNTMWAFMAALGVSKHAGIISSAYAVYRQHASKEFEDEFLDSILRIPPYKAEYFCRSTGIRSSRLRLYPDQLLKIPLFCPPRKEQLEIVRKIKVKTKQISTAVLQAEKEIQLMNEFRTALIAETVTGKIDVRGFGKVTNVGTEETTGVFD